MRDFCISRLGLILAALLSFPAYSATHAATGHLAFTQTFFDFGSATEGDILKHTFKFKNAGPGPVRIVGTETSCGCTTLNGVVREYAPGEESAIEAVVDTRDKKGIVVKTITLHLENGDANKIELSLAMQLNPPPHPRIGNRRNINKEAECNTCHLQSGEGQSGVFLFHRVCSQCHGKKGAGGFGRALNDAAWQKVDDGYIRHMIHNGMPEKGMPSFVQGVSPPLSDEQVESLVTYIRSLAK